MGESDIGTAEAAITPSLNKLGSESQLSKNDTIVQRELEEKTELSPAIKQAKELKDKWNRSYFLTPETLAADPLALTYATKQQEVLDQEIIKSPVYVADTPEGRETRLLRTHEDLAHEAEYMIERMLETPSVLPPDISQEQAAQIIREYIEFCRGKQIYTRPGLNGVVDILNDKFLRAQISQTRLARYQELDVERLLPHVPIGQRESIQKMISRGEDEQASAEILMFVPPEIAKKYSAKIHQAEQKESGWVQKTAESLERIAHTFNLEKIDLAHPETLPLEVQLTIREDPSIEGLLRALSEQGVSLALQRIQSTPPSILHSISRIAVVSQENFTSTWLPDFVLKGVQPQIVPTEKGLARARHMEIMGQEEEKLQADVGYIEHSISGFLQLRALNPQSFTGQQREMIGTTITNLNKRLEQTRREYALHRITIDHADERTAEAQEVIKKMGYIGPIAHGLELAGLGGLADMVASTLDDTMGEVAEFKALTGSGFPLKELLPRLRIIAPVGIGAMALSSQVESLVHQGRVLEAGALFGTTAVALSLTTAILSVKMYHDNLRELAKNGKLDSSRTVSSEELKSQEIIQDVEQTFSQFGIQRSVTEKIVSALHQIDLKVIAERLRKSQFGVAVEQDFSNPARKGLALGIAAAPVAGMVAGQLGGLENGFILAGVGSMESITAMVTVMLAKRLAESGYMQQIRSKISASNLT